MTVRSFRESDSAAVRSLLEAAFATPVEADLVERLRADGDAVIELVAEEAGAVVGHILFSPVDAPFPALALAPVAVSPVRQRCGIGSALVEEGHRRALAEGQDAIFVLGEPEYYRRFGYDAASAAGFGSPYAGPYFMVLPLQGRLPADSGEVRHARAFADLG